MKNYYFILKSEYIHELKLRGIERDTFAVIDSCYHAGSRWRGSTAKLAYMIGASVRSIERSITSLIDNNFISLLNDGSLIPSESALGILDKGDKMSKANDKMSRQNVVQKKEAKKTEINNSNNLTSTSNTEDDEEYIDMMFKFFIDHGEGITGQMLTVYSWIDWFVKNFPGYPANPADVYHRLAIKYNYEL